MNQRRRAPPPLSVVVESTEPTGDEILMLSEEQAGTISRPSAMDHNNVRASWVANSSGFADQVISQDASSPELGTSLVEQFQVDDSPRRLPGASNLPAAEATMPSAHRYNPNGDAEDTMMC